MTVADRRQREREELRQKILDTARELFVEHGYEGVTLRKIAEAIEYAPGTIYSYFADKEALIRALCVEDWQSFEQSFPRGPAASSDPVELLRTLGMGYVKFALGHPNHYRLMFMSPKAVPLDDEALSKRGDPALDGYALLQHTVAKAMEARLLREELTDPALVAQTLWAGVHGVVSLEITMGSDPWLDWAPIEARTNMMLETIMRGLGRIPGAAA